MADKDKKIKLKLFHYITGLKGREVHSTFFHEGPKRAELLMKTFDEYCEPRKKMRKWTNTVFSICNQYPEEGINHNVIELNIDMHVSFGKCDKLHY